MRGREAALAHSAALRSKVPTQPAATSEPAAAYFTKATPQLPSGARPLGLGDAQPEMLSKAAAQPPARAAKGGGAAPPPCGAALPALATQQVAAARTAALLVLAQAWAEHGKVVKTLVAGAASGIVSRTCTSPLEVVATLQMSGVGYSGGLLAQLSALHAANGPAGFFSGNGANCLKVAPTRAIQFAVYERVKLAMLRRSAARAACDHAGRPGAPKEAALSPLERLVAGGVAGMVACSIVYPVEVIKTMLTVSKPGTYGGIADAFRHAYLDGGVRGFYKGWLPTMFAMFPYVGVEFMIYECFKQAYARAQVAGGRNAADLPAAVHLAIGACAGAAAQTAAHPLDVIRRRLQMQGKNGRPVLYGNMFDGLYKLGRTEGIGALYRGLKPACAEKIPSTAVTFFAYGVFKSILGLSTI